MRLFCLIIFQVMLAIKLTGIGKKHQRSFRVVIQEKRSKLGGQSIEDLGWYNPRTNKFEVKNRVSSTKLAVESSKLDIENTKYQLRKTVQQAYQNAIAAQARLTAAQKSGIASKEAFRYAEQKYEAGRASVYELYQAKSNLTQVLSELTQSKYEYVLRIKVLELLK